MFLPPWIWKTARSRRTKVALVWAPFLMLAGVVAFYGIANWMGEREVKQHLEWLRSEGFTTSLEELNPPPQRPEDNMMSHPAVVAELERSSDDRLIRFSTRRFEKRFSGLARTVKRPERSMGEGEDILSYFRPVRHPDETAAARELLDGLAPEWERLEAMLPALNRPVAVWKISYLNVDGVRYPQEADLIGFGQVLGMAEKLAVFALAAGEPEQAFVMTDMQLKFGRHVFQAGQTSVSGLVGSLSLTTGANSIHEGILRQMWTDGMLVAFDRQLQEMAPQATFVRGIPGEAAYQEANYEMVRQALSTAKADFTEGWEADREVVVKRLRGLWWTTRPSGIALSELTRSNRELLKHGLVRGNEKRRRFGLDDFKEFQRNEEEVPVGIAGEPGLFGSEIISFGGRHWNDLKMIAMNSLASETSLVLLRTGIALERHRLRYGKHPADLAALVPEFLPEVLADPYDLQPLRYVIRADGSPWLWSVGLNGMDDAGLPHGDAEKGDRVWITSPIAGFTEADYWR